MVSQLVTNGEVFHEKRKYANILYRDYQNSTAFKEYIGRGVNFATETMSGVTDFLLEGGF